jgi:hypothetical protein
VQQSRPTEYLAVKTPDLTQTTTLYACAVWCKSECIFCTVYCYKSVSILIVDGVPGKQINFIPFFIAGKFFTPSKKKKQAGEMVMLWI